MRCVVFVLATLALVGCQDALQPAQPVTSLPVAHGAPGSYDVVNLGTLDRTSGFGGGGSRAFAVNNQGQIVGSSRTGVGEPAPWGVRHAFLWENGMMTDLGSLGQLSEATAINDLGQVVGRYVTSSFQERAFIWQNGVMQDLGPAGGFSLAVAINNNGQVLGWNGRAFVWQDGVISDLGTLGGNGSRGHDLNGAGQVVGESQTAAGDVRAFMWANGAMRDLGTLGGTYSAAFAISETGAVTGASTDPSGRMHAFTWRDGVIRDLGILPGYAASKGVVINARGDVAGQASDPSTYGEHAFLWRGGALHDLGTLGGPTTFVHALGAAGQVAGTSLRSASVASAHAIVWDRGTLQDLGALPGHVYSEANAMNRQGDVVGVSYQELDSDLYRAVLWRRVGGSPGSLISIRQPASTASRRPSGAPAVLRGTAAAPSSPPSRSPTTVRQSRSG